MAAETELERMVVRLTADASEYMKALQEAQQQTVAAGKQIEIAAANIGTAFQTVGAAVAAVGFERMAKSALSAWQEEESAVLKLTATLEGNGRAVQETLEDYLAFASEVQRTTVLADEQVDVLLRQAETFGKTGAAAKEMVKNSIALAGAVDGTAESAGSYIRIANAMADGNIELAMHMSRLVPQLRGVKDEAEFTAKFNQLVASGLKTVNAEASSSAGQMRQLSNAWSDFQETIGKVIAEALVPVLEWLRETISWMQGWPPVVKTATTVVLGLGAATAGLLATAGSAVLIYNNLIASLVTYVSNITAAKLATVAFNTAITAAMAAIALGAINLADMDTRLQGLNKNLQEAGNMSAELAQKDVGVGFAMSFEGIDQQREELLKYRKQIVQDMQIVGAKADELNSDWGQFARGITGGLYGRQTIKDMEELNKSFASVEIALKGLEKAAPQAKAAEASLKAKQSVDELTKGLQLQVQTFGKTANQAAIFKISLEEGVTPAMLEAAKAAAAMLEEMERDRKANEEAAQRSKALADSISNLKNNLKDSIATFGLTADEVAIYKLSVEGASQAELVQLKTLALQKKAMEDRSKMVEEGKRVTEQYQKPLDAFYARMAELQNLMDAGVVSQDVFNTAMKDAEQRFIDAERAARKAKEEVQQFDAALAGSAEAARRLDAYKGALGNLRQQGRVSQQAESARQTFDFQRRQSQLAAGSRGPGFGNAVATAQADVAAGQAALAVGSRGEGINKLLMRIASATEKEAARPGVTLEPTRIP